MAEVNQITFSYKELAEVLVKKEGIHEGLWGIWVEFGVKGANIGSDPERGDLLPAAIIPIVKIGIQRFKEESQLTVDAAKVNPKKPRRSSKKTTKK